MADSITVYRMQNLSKSKIRFFNDAAGEWILNPGQVVIILPEAFAKFEKDFPGEIAKLSYKKQLEVKQEPYDEAIVAYRNQ